MEKILVLGAKGMAGHLITFYFMERGYDVTAYTRTPFPYCRNITGDARDAEKLTEILTSKPYDVVINCIGLLNRFAEERPAEAVYLNSYLPHLIAGVLKGRPTKLIQMSTDCVFAGNTGPYDENSLRDGRTFYDRTKALGEVEDDKNLTFRNSIVGPDINREGIGLFNWFMKQHLRVQGYTGAIWTGVTTLTLARAMEQAFRENLTGIYNLVNNESISKYHLLVLFNRYFRNNEVEIQENDDVQLDKSLRNNRSDFSFQVPSYEEMVREMKEWVDAHASLYSY